MAFVSGFFYNRFSFQPSVNTKDMIMDLLSKNSQQIPISIIIHLLVALSDLDLIDIILASMVTLQSIQNTNLLSYNSFLPYIEKSFTILTIPEKDNIVNLHSLLLD